MGEKKLYKWTVKNDTYMAVGIAFAVDPENEISRMLFEHDIPTSCLYYREIEESELLHVLMECDIDKSQLC